MAPLDWGQIHLCMAWRFWPVWLALGATLALSFALRERLGLYGRLFDSATGVAGLGLALAKWEYPQPTMGVEYRYG